MGCYVPHHVFTFSGRMAGAHAPPAAWHGTAVASTPYDVIRTMTEVGFEVVALASLHDLEGLIEVLSTTRRDLLKALSEGDLMATDAMKARLDRGYQATRDELFSFAGHTGVVGSVSSGFIAAGSATAACTFLATFGYEVHAITSLSELHREVARLQKVARGEGDPAEVIDLFDSEAAAA